ncbi:putative transcription factor PosF21 [Canna indica]|uniref:Transcription factor PosF21 n=1 Tax=Canna indica TaxID=4628 RepID=A0AAQ3JVR2_9LILI|nr:putative transcription factor PosF21 [Canna indica]
MGEAEAARGDLMQRLKPSPASTSTCSTAVPPNTSTFFRQFAPNCFGPDAARRPGIPPIPPSPSSSTAAAAHVRSPSPTSSSGAVHSRSISQPHAFFSLDSLPPSPSPPPFAAAAAASDADRARPVSAGLPPRKAHRRSQSDVPIGFLHPPLSPVAAAGTPSAMLTQQRARPPPQQVKQETEWDKDTESSGEGIGDRKSEGDAADDLFNAYMNLDSLEALNSSGMEEKNEDLDSSRLSGTRTNMADSSENEAESSMNESSGGGSKKEGNKRSAAGDLTPITTRHFRSLSMDSLMGKLHFGDESPKLPPSPGNQMGHHSRSGSMDGTANALSPEFGNGEFTSAEMKKIMANEKLAEMAMTDPKRVKRILANRQSAARSKERKMRYISELEHKVQTLQTEATTLSAQLTLLQRDSAGLTCQNNELRIRLQAMEQQAQLRDAINEALTAEVQRLKLATGEITEAQLQKNIHQQMPVNAQIFQQSNHISHYQFQSPQQQQHQQQNSAMSEPESKN